MNIKDLAIDHNTKVVAVNGNSVKTSNNNDIKKSEFNYDDKYKKIDVLTEAEKFMVGVPTIIGGHKFYRLPK